MSSIISKLINLAGNITGTLPIANGGTGQATKTAAFDALSPMTAKGDLIAGGASGTGTALAVGSNGQGLIADSAQTLGIKWAPVLANPMTTLGDIIYEDATPVPARLGGNTTATKNFLTQTGTGSISAVPAWGTIASGDLPAATTSNAGAVKLNVVTTQILSGNIATGGAGQAVTDWTFTTVAGVTYLVTGQVYISNLAVGENTEVDFYDGTSGGTLIGTNLADVDFSVVGLSFTHLNIRSSVSFVYTATQTTFQAYVTSTNSNGRLLGDGTRGRSFIQLTRLNNV